MFDLPMFVYDPRETEVKKTCEENEEKENTLREYAWNKNMDICSCLMHL